MRVLVGIEVRELHSCGLDAIELGCGFGFNLLRIELMSKRGEHEVVQAIAKARGTVASSGLKEGRNPLLRQQRFAIEQNHVATNAQRRDRGQRFCQSGRLMEGGGIRHERCGSYNAAIAGFRDGAIDP